MKAFYETRQYESHVKIWHRVYRNLAFVPHWHTEIEMIYIREGALEVTLESESVRATKGDLIIVESGEIHYSNIGENTNVLEFIIFDPAIINSIFKGFNLKTALLTKNTLKKSQLTKHLLALLCTINHEVKYKNKYYDEIIAAELRKFCLLLKRNAAYLINDNQPKSQRDRIDEFQSFLDYLEQNYSEDISLSDGAKYLNLNTSYFSTLFKDYTGSTFVRYLNALRVEKALEAIQKNEQSIIEIAYDCGYNNIRSFNRVFKEFTGIAPSQFMKVANQDEYIYKIRKSAHIEHTEEFENKTILTLNGSV